MMRMILVLFLTAFVMSSAQAAGVGCPSVSVNLPPLPGLRAEVASGQDVTIVALGSSSTEGAGGSSPEASYPARLQALLRTALPRVPLRVVNAGRSGETSRDMMARMERDVVALQPDLVIWQAGGNEALNGQDPTEFTTQMEAGLQRLREAGIPAILMDNQRAPRILSAPGSVRFTEALSILARQFHVGLFPRGRVMTDWAAKGLPPTSVLAVDDLHHNDLGYACLAEALSTALLNAAGLATQIAAR